MASASVNLHALAADMRAIPHTGMIAAAKAAKKIALEEGARVAGADGMLGKKRRGLKLKARDDIRHTDTGSTCRIQGVSPAAWVWANTGTRPHDIRRRKRGPMKKMTVHHPGTAGRHAWRRVEERIVKVVPEIFRDLVHEAVEG